jgi:hypothetical protein
MYMRKILVALMLICAIGLFAQIPAGTKSVAVLTGSTSDLLGDGDFEYAVDIYGGYFLMDALEIDAILGIDSDIDMGDMGFTLGAGAMYHLPLSPMLGVYAGAAFTYMTAYDGIMAVPIDAGLEVFLTSNNAVRLGGRFTLNLEEGAENTLNIVLGTVHYF